MRFLLMPIAWCYGLIVRLRNYFFDINLLKKKSYDIPIISVGNITVCGTGKTPHTEYIVKLLKDSMKVGVLSRGYKRKTKGFVLADENTTMREIGDEPFQMHKKFPDVTVAVCEKRCKGIDNLINKEETKNLDVIVLDDAFQHRYVTPGVNILLVNYNKLIVYDKLLPYGTLREPLSGKNRADIVIITKCPHDITPMEVRIKTKIMDLFPYQSLFFSTLNYGNLTPLTIEADSNVEETRQSKELTQLQGCNVLLVTGIGEPSQITKDLEQYGASFTELRFRDHHKFSKKDVAKINSAFTELPEPKVLITTEKDATRIYQLKGFSNEVCESIYTLPIEVEFLHDGEKSFNKKIIDYVYKNSRNSSLAKRKNDHKANNSDNTRNGTRTVSFRDHR